MNESELVLLGVIELSEAKRIRSALLMKRIELEFMHNPETCTSKNCKTSVEVYVRPEQLDEVRAFLQAERATLLDGLAVTPGFEDQVFDPTKSEATCPACGTQFSTTATECPDCGLSFSAEAQ